MLRSAYFRLLVMGVVLANGVITATMNFKHDGNPRQFFYQKYYYIEVNCIIIYIYNTMLLSFCRLQIPITNDQLFFHQPAFLLRNFV